MNVIDCSKCIHCEVCGNRYANDGCAGECSYFLEYNPSGDLISREAVRSKIWKERVEKDEGCNSEYIRGLKTAIGFIDNAQTIPLPNEQTAWEQGYEAGLAQGKQDRTKGEWIKIDEEWYDYKCSVCGEKVRRLYPFCHCGADMRPKGGDPDEENA